MHISYSQIDIWPLCMDRHQTLESIYKMKKKILLPALLLAAFISAGAKAQNVNIELQLPEIGNGQYKRPYVAVWVEKKGERRALKTLAVWHEDKKWLKDIRRWWRKAGRYNPNMDGMTGATRPPGTYKLTWQAEDTDGKALTGDYLICLEASREHGNRTLFKQAITLGSGVQEYRIAAGAELGPVMINIGE